MTIKKYQDILALAKKGKSDAQYEMGIFYEDGLTVKNKVVIKPNKKRSTKMAQKSLQEWK